MGLVRGGRRFRNYFFFLSLGSGGCEKNFIRMRVLIVCLSVRKERLWNFIFIMRINGDTERVLW